MFGRNSNAAHIEFLERIKAQLDKALAPPPAQDFHAVSVAACLAKQTGCTVTFTNEEPAV